MRNNRLNCISDSLCTIIANGDDVNLVRSALGEYGKSIKICAKVDDLQVVERYDEILQEADAMIFAREDLQYEL